MRPVSRSSLCVLVCALASCFEVPAFEDGELLCDDGRCPPGMECRTDSRCHAKGGGATLDAPLSTSDAMPTDSRASDASPGDARRVDAAPVFDASPQCTGAARRCVANNVEICVNGFFVPSSPSCAQQTLDCFDPDPPGGGDAYCGVCLNGAQRCAGTAPPVRQVCMSGTWVDAEPCAAFGCYDPDGAAGSMAYCGVCANGDLRCNPGLETCTAGQWPAGVDCTATSGWSCFDPAPTGGSDPYCGLCLKNAFVCHGSSSDQCNAQGTDFVAIENCSWGCLASTGACCAAPSCGGRECGPSPMNACGRQIPCGSCSGTQICIAGMCESGQ